MKTYILILTLLGLTSCGTAQTIVPIENEKGFQEQDGVTYYYKDVNGALAKFIGTWKYETATESFEITFYLRIKKDNGSSFEDQLMSKFKYIKNGVEIYNTYQERDQLNFFGGFFTYPNNTNKINMSYHEPNVGYKSRRKRLKLEFVPSTSIGASNMIIWQRDVWQGSPTPPPYQIPKTMTLVKQ